MLGSTPALQRAAPLVHLAPLLAEKGVALDAVLAGTGISTNDIRPENFVPYAAVLEILDRAAALSGCEDIGLQIGFRQGLGTIGLAGEVMRHAATLGEALSDFAAFQITNSTGASVYLHRADDEVMWGYGVYDASHAASVQIHDLVLAAGSVLLAELTGGAVRAVELASMRPAPADIRPWLRLGAPIRFGQDRTCIFLTRAAAAFPLPTADQTVREAALAVIGPLVTKGSWGWAGRTQHAMRALLLEGRSRMPLVAHHLGIHPRTLSRALRREGTTFEQIKDDVRYAMARELLTLTSLPVGEIAETLDFATSSAFIHAFHRWSGTTPAEWREGIDRANGRTERG